jgi:zinc protease
MPASWRFSKGNQEENMLRVNLKTSLSRGLALIAIVVLGAGIAPALAKQDSEIAFTKTVLDNGLTLLVHEDHKAPIVAVNVWYHVGSKNEKPGRTGFAHLFEHLMFNGSENNDDDYFQVLEKIGATTLNGTTNEDRTNYFQNVPTSSLDVVLWMESDRMGHLLGAITQEKLDEQRGVVQNEKRQFENQPYALAEEMIVQHTYPEGHPYSWTVIGSMEDLNAAALEDVHQWFKDYYGAANAVIVLAGDITPEAAKEKVQRFFGHIPSGPPVPRPQAWVAKREGTIRQSAEDRVPHARVFKVWNVPASSTVAHDHLERVADILASGKNSRLYKRLVYDEQIALNVNAYVDSREIGSLFRIEATAQPDAELAAVEAAVDEELARLFAEGPTAEELARVKVGRYASFVRSSEGVGGFGGKSDILARNQVYAGDPQHFAVQLARFEAATADDLRATAGEWLSDGVYVLEVHPFKDYTVAESDVDRSKVPSPGVAPEPHFVKLRRDKLSNGMKLILAERHSTPVVELSLMADAGYAADSFAVAGTAQLAMTMLDEGTKTRNALQISEQLNALGAQLFSGSNLDVSSVNLSALTANLEASLELMADVVMNPAFPENEFQRLQRQQLSAIDAQKANPIQMALRVFPMLLYGQDHAYGTPFTGSGHRHEVEKLTRGDLVKFHETWIRPNNSTMLIVGDTTMAEIKPKLERLFKGWKQGKVPAKNLGTVAQKNTPTVYIIDKPDAIQSVILAGHVAPPRGREDDLAVETMNTVLGGSFTSRLNMNLREDKHWAYGAGSVMVDAKGQRPFLAYAPVQTDKTRESMAEVQKELEAICGPRPVSEEELVKVKDKKVLELPGTWETNGAVLGSLAEMVRFGLEDNYFDSYADNVRALSVGQVGATAREMLHPDKLVWVVVGDRAKIEADIRELGLGQISLLDVDGNPIQ